MESARRFSTAVFPRSFHGLLIRIMCLLKGWQKQSREKLGLVDKGNLSLTLDPLLSSWSDHRRARKSSSFFPLLCVWERVSFSTLELWSFFSIVFLSHRSPLAQHFGDVSSILHDETFTHKLSVFTRSHTVFSLHPSKVCLVTLHSLSLRGRKKVKEKKWRKKIGEEKRSKNS